MTKKGTTTSSFGTGKREAHDSSLFYQRNLFNGHSKEEIQAKKLKKILIPKPGEWVDKIYHQTSENMSNIPENSVSLAFTSPPYNVGKDYDDDLEIDKYLELIGNVAKEIYRVLRPGGRYIVNVANLGRKPYIPLHAFFYKLHMEIGFLPMGEIIWQKGRGASGSCAWGSWKSAKSPRLRDLHEYLLVFAKQSYSRPDNGESDISRDEFMASSLSIWEIPPESAKRIGHPAPFPVELAARVIRFYSFVGDIVLDPFAGSGSTCIAALLNQRHYIGYDVNAEYVALSESRIEQAKKSILGE